MRASFGGVPPVGQEPRWDGDLVHERVVFAPPQAREDGLSRPQRFHVFIIDVPPAEQQTGTTNDTYVYMGFLYMESRRG